MRAVIVERPGVVRVDDVPEPEPGPDEVVLQVGACGICGTDIHIVDGEFPPAKYPVIRPRIRRRSDGGRRRTSKTFRSATASESTHAQLRRLLLLPTRDGKSLRALERGRRRHHAGGFAEYVAVPGARRLSHT